MTFPQVVDVDGVLFGAAGVPTQPAFALLDGNGNVETHLGPLDQAQLAAFVESGAQPQR